MNIVFVKVGKAVDWFEIDDTPESQEYLQDVVEPFLDLSVATKGNNGIAKKLLYWEDSNGNKYSASVKELVSGAIKLYYSDSPTPPNLTPFESDRRIGMATDLFVSVADFIYDYQRSKTTTKQP